MTSYYRLEHTYVKLFTLFFAVLFGLVLAFFAIQNTGNVTIVLAGAPIPGIPLWLVVVVSILIGLVTASYFNVVNIVSSAFKLHSKNETLKSADSEIAGLRHENQRLKGENEGLSSKKDPS